MLFDCGKENEQKEAGESPKLEVSKEELWLALPQTFLRSITEATGPLSPAVSCLQSADAASFLSSALFPLVTLDESNFPYNCTQL